MHCFAFAARLLPAPPLRLLSGPIRPITAQAPSNWPAPKNGWGPPPGFLAPQKCQERLETEANPHVAYESTPSYCQGGGESCSVCWPGPLLSSHLFRYLIRPDPLAYVPDEPPVQSSSLAEEIWVQQRRPSALMRLLMRESRHKG